MRTYLKNNVLLAVALVLAAVSGTGCSIKEDRVPCPAFLNVMFADKESIGGTVGLLGYGASELFRVDLDVMENDPYVRAVRKSVFGLSAYYGDSVASSSGHYMTIPLGSECDSLYAWHTEVDCTVNESVYAEVVLHKQFCTVHLDLLKPLTGNSAISNYSFLVEGNTCGFDLLDFEPVMGTYRIEPRAVEGSRVVDFRVPRQVDDSMTVAIWYTHPDIAMPVLVGGFPLGEYIRRLGYRWDTEDLQDIYVVIDTITGLVTINVEGWEDGYTFTFIEQ